MQCYCRDECLYPDNIYHRHIIYSITIITSPLLKKGFLCPFRPWHRILYPTATTVTTNCIYKIIQIVRALWLAIKPFYMSVCQHGFRSSFISYSRRGFLRLSPVLPTSRVKPFYISLISNWKTEVFYFGLCFVWLCFVLACINFSKFWKSEYRQKFRSECFTNVVLTSFIIGKSFLSFSRISQPYKGWKAIDCQISKHSVSYSKLFEPTVFFVSHWVVFSCWQQSPTVAHD